MEHPDQAQEREWLDQSALTYGALIGTAVLMVQPFLTAPSLDLASTISVIAFSVAIPLLAALILVSRQETFHGRRTKSILVIVSQAVGQGAAMIGLVAAFWHIHWIAGVGLLVSGFVAIAIHSAGFWQLELDVASDPEEPPV
jgi:O-antigen/teichoic acid export membrane protein